MAMVTWAWSSYLLLLTYLPTYQAPLGTSAIASSFEIRSRTINVALYLWEGGQEGGRLPSVSRYIPT